MQRFFTITVYSCFAFVCCKSVSSQGKRDYRLNEVIQKAEIAARKIKDVTDRIGRFSEIAVIYGNSGDKSTARGIILQCLKLASTIADRTERYHMQIVILERQAGYGDHIEAHRNVEKYVEDRFKSPVRWFIVSTTTLTNKNLDDATEIAKTILRKQERDWSYSDISYAWASRGNEEEAFKIAEKIEDNNRKSHAYLLVTITLLEKGKLDLAKKTVKRIIDPRLKLRALRGIASTQLEVGRKKDTLKTIEEAKQFAENPSDQISLLLLAFEAGEGDIKKTIRLAKKITDVETRSYEFASIALSLTKIQGSDHAFRLLQKHDISTTLLMQAGEILTDIALIETRMKGVDVGLKIVDLMDPNSYEHDLAVKKIAIFEAEQERFEKALKVIANVKSHYHKSEGLKEIAILEYRKGMKNAAQKTFERAIEAAMKVEIGGGTDVILLTELSVAQVKIQDVEHATKSFQLAIQKATKYTEESYQGQLIGDILKAQTKAMGKNTTFKRALAYPSAVIRAQALIGIAEGLQEYEKSLQKN